MESSAKIIIGMLVTGLVGIGAHSLGSMGSSYVDRLETRSNEALEKSDIKGVNVTFVRDPTIKRIAILTGDVSPSDRKAALDLVQETPGLAEAYWDEAAAYSNSSAKVATDTGKVAEKDKIVTRCQADIDNIMNGKTINFRSGSAYVPPSSFALMDEIADVMKPCTGANIEVQGHTDLRGSAAINNSVSQARADAVKAALVERGVDAQAISARGYGGAQPLDKARTAEADTKNRRTIFLLSTDNKP